MLTQSPDTIKLLTQTLHTLEIGNAKSNFRLQFFDIGIRIICYWVVADQLMFPHVLDNENVIEWVRSTTLIALWCFPVAPELPLILDIVPHRFCQTSGMLVNIQTPSNRFDEPFIDGSENI